MKKALIFLTGMVVGYFGCIKLFHVSASRKNETIYEDDDIEIKMVTNDKLLDLDHAIVYYKDKK